MSILFRDFRENDRNSEPSLTLDPKSSSCSLHACPLGIDARLRRRSVMFSPGFVLLLSFFCVVLSQARSLPILSLGVSQPQVQRATRLPSLPLSPKSLLGVALKRLIAKRQASIAICRKIFTRPKQIDRLFFLWHDDSC